MGLLMVQENVSKGEEMKCQKCGKSPAGFGPHESFCKACDEQLMEVDEDGL